jgi:hypothetical protein
MNAFKAAALSFTMQKGFKCRAAVIRHGRGQASGIEGDVYADPLVNCMVGARSLVILRSAIS